MGRPIFEVIQQGVFTSIQDLGRTGYFAVGIPPSGAMDRFALRMGNLLLKNPLGEAGIEVTALGVKLRVLENTVIALTGGDFDAKINGRSIPCWHTIDVGKGDVLSMEEAKAGWRGYICVAGGIDVPVVLGSKSTYLTGALGGIRGRLIRRGDVLEVGDPRIPFESLKGRRVKKTSLPQSKGEKKLRVILGPQDDHVKDESIQIFLSSSYRASIHSNRIGYRFEGPQLYFKERPGVQLGGSNPSNIVDDGNAIGAIQIPGGKEPICLGPDGVSMGGYVKIACLITADMDRMAQLRLRETIQFKSVTIAEARSALEESLNRVNEMNIEVE
jgi:biotin-dependent carboxylase-like uncharacterized protein